MGYSYYCGDSDSAVTAGSAVSSLNYGGVIQQNDGYGGTNHTFGIPGALGLYHVHFNSTGKKVNVVRYKADSAAEGTNLLRWDNAGGAGTERQNLKGLALYLKDQGYPNHAKLMKNLSEAIG